LGEALANQPGSCCRFSVGGKKRLSKEERTMNNSGHSFLNSHCSLLIDIGGRTMNQTKTLFFVIALFAGSITAYAGGQFNDIANTAKKANEAVQSVNNVVRDVDSTIEGVGGIKGGVKDIGQDTADVLGVDTTSQPKQAPAQTQPQAIQAQAQTPSGAVPLPPLPNVTFTLQFKDSVVSQQQLRKLYENRDQRKYTEYLFNSGYITEAEFKKRSESQDQEYYKMLETVGDQYTMIDAAGTVEKEVNKLWPFWSPVWPGKEIRETSGLNLRQPPGTRSSFSFDKQMIREVSRRIPIKHLTT
jgi:hypothetical protein